MKMTESYIWKKLDSSIPGAHFTRHEDKLSFGIPDVSYGYHGKCGWIELKAYRIPRSLSSVPSFKKFKRTQRKFLKNRGKAGGNCWLLIGFGRCIMLLSYKYVGLCGEATFNELWEKCHFYGDINEISGIADYL